MQYTAVFGSIFVDVKGFPFGEYNPIGRNIGDVKRIHGGVCRNVSENLANIGSPVSFVTVFDPDGCGSEVRIRLNEHGVDLRYAASAERGMGMWLAVFDEKGNLAGSISRQPVFDAMERIVDEEGDEIVRGCSNIVLEVDMRASIAKKVFDLAEKYNKDVYVVVGNMGVILQHPEYLSRARMFILNEIEAGALFGCTVDPADPPAALEKLEQEMKLRGIREMVITLGAHGAVYCDSASGAAGHVPAHKVEMVDSTGAGDAFFTATVAARMRGWSLEEAAKLGARLAALTIQSEESACPRMKELFAE